MALCSAMEETRMEVNLCPSTSSGIASCSVRHYKGGESCSPTVVRLDLPVTAVCPDNGEIQFRSNVSEKDGDCRENTGGRLEQRHLKNCIDSMLGMAEHVMAGKGGCSERLTVRDKLLSRNTKICPDSTIQNTKDKVNPQDADSAKRHHGDLKSSSSLRPSKKRKLSEVSGSDSEGEKKPRKNKQWLESNMQKAIYNVQHGMQVRKAAKAFNVPRTTLTYRVDSKTPNVVAEKNQWNEDLMLKAIEATQGTMSVRVAAKQFKVPRSTLQDRMKSDKIKSHVHVTSKQHGKGKEKAKNCIPHKAAPQLRSRSATADATRFKKSCKTSLKLPQKNYDSNKDSNSDKETRKSLVAKAASIEKVKTNSLEKKLETGKIECQKKSGPKNKNKEKRTFKQWSEETMRQAMHAVENGSKIRDAALLFEVPRSTLGGRLCSSRRKLPVRDTCRTTRCFYVKEAAFQVQTSGDNLGPMTKRQFILPSPLAPKYPVINLNANILPKKDTKKEEVLKTSGCSAPKVSTATQSKTLKKKKGRGRLKKWANSNSMEKALEALEHGMSVNLASKTFSVPRTTLTARKCKRDNAFFGPEPCLSSEDEDHLVNYVNDCGRFGIINMKDVVLLLAAEKAENKQMWDLKQQGSPSDEWWYSFCSRKAAAIKNPDIALTNKSAQLSDARVSLFYDKLTALQNSSEYHSTSLVNCSDCRTFTVQEFQFDMDCVSKLIHKGASSENTTLDTSGDKLVSTICCANAAGNSIPPMFVYHTENDYKIPDAGLVGPFGAVHFVHNVKDMSRKRDFYFKWFTDVLLKYAPPSRPLIVLLDPQTAFVTPEFIKLAHTNEIILLCLPPSTEQITQPLNRTVLPSLNKGFAYTSSLFKRIFLKGVNFSNFARCFKVAWNASVDAEVIKSGFAKAGIHPLKKQVTCKSEPQTLGCT